MTTEGPGQGPQPTPPPGWYTDANDPALFRWWDGGRWTEHTSPQHGGATQGTGYSGQPQAQGGGGCGKVFGWVLLAIIGLVILGSLLPDPAPDKGGSGGDTAAEDGGDNPTSGRVGEPISLEGTTYEVTSVDSMSSVGDNEFTRVDANGQFVVVKLTLTNDKDEPATILEDNIRLIGGNGKNYSASDDAILAYPNQTLLLEEIQPSNTEDGVIVYDLPESAVSGAKLQMEDFWSDATAEVDLGL